MTKKTAEAEPETGTDIVAIPTNPIALFTDGKQFDAFYAKVKAETDKLVPDVTTDKGRKAIASMAFRVAQAKVKLDNAGKDLTEDARKTIDAVNASRRKIREDLDALKDEVRAPLTAWEEAEAARVARCAEIMERIKSTSIVTEDDTSETVRARGREIWETEIGDDFGDQKDAAEAAKAYAVNAMKESLARLIREEADRAELERLRAAEAERLEAERVKAEQAEAERIERERVEAERIRAEQAKADEAKRIADAAAKASDDAKREAEERHAAELQAERDRANEAERQAQAERDRIAAQERETEATAERARSEQAARDKDKANRTAVKTAAKEAIMACGVPEDAAVKVVLSIIAGDVPNVTLRF